MRALADLPGNCDIDMKGVVWNESLYGAAFRKLGLEIVNEKRRWPILDGRVKRTDVVGISVVDPDADDADSDDDETDVADAAAGAKETKRLDPLPERALQQHDHRA